MGDLFKSCRFCATVELSLRAGYASHRKRASQLSRDFKAFEEIAVTAVSSPSSMSFRLATIAALLTGGLVLSACSPMGEKHVHGIIITESMLSQVKPGTSQAAVVDILGTPSTTSTLNGEAYYYVTEVSSRPVAFMRPTPQERNVVAVYFAKGRVTRVANYGMQDGVVFDFVSRTTPTSGSELNFLSQLMRGLLGGDLGLRL